MAVVFISVAAGIGSAIAAVGVGVYTSALIAYAITGAIVVAGTAALIGKLAPDMPGGMGGGTGGDYDSKSKGILLNKRSNNAPIPVVYGTRLVGGTIVFLATGTDTDNLYVNIVMSEGQIESFTNVYFNGKISTDESFDAPITNIRRYYGTETQLGDSTIAIDLSYYATLTHRLKGTAYLSLTLKFTPETFTSGLPTITSEVKGVKVFDPRSSLTVWSDNPVLCVRDYLTNTRYGRGIDTSLIDDASFIVSANYCDELIFIAGFYKKRYVCDGVVQTENRSLDIIRELLTACRGFLVYSGGKYKLIIDKPEIPVFTFSEENIIGKWDITLGNKNTMFNRIRANFFNKDKEYQPDLVVIDSPALRIQDDGVLLERMIDLPFTTDIARAKMIATINLNQSRQSISCEFNTTIEGMLAEVGDVVYIKHDTPGWSELNSGQGKKFRIMKIILQNTDEVRIQAREYETSAFEYGTIAIHDTEPDTSLPDLSIALPPTNLITEESTYVTTNSAGEKIRLDISWTAPDEGFIASYDVEYKKSSDTTWNQLTNTKNTTARLNDVPSVNMDIRVRTVNTVGVVSLWTTLSNITIQGLITTTVFGSGLSATVTATTVMLLWHLSTDITVLSGGRVIFRHSSELTGATWNNSIPISIVAAGNSNAIVLPFQVGTYLARFVDVAGNESADYGTVVVKTSVDIINPQVVINLPQH